MRMCLDADLTLAQEGEGATARRMAAAYRPPLGALGARLDRLILHRVAVATVQGFLGRVGKAITHPARAGGPAWGNEPRGLSSLPPDAEVS